jgi:hypothetical protein
MEEEEEEGVVMMTESGVDRSDASPLRTRFFLTRGVWSNSRREVEVEVEVEVTVMTTLQGDSDLAAAAAAGTGAETGAAGDVDDC